MNAGSLNQRLTLQAKEITRDQLNAEIEDWTDQGDVWADVKMITGRTQYAANQVHEPTTIEATIRRGPAVTNLWRAIWRVTPGDTTRDRILNIVAVLPLPARDGFTLLCSEGINAG